MPPLDTLQGQMVLVDELLKRDHGTNLSEYLTKSRDAGVSFEMIARDLSQLLDVSGFTVTYQTIRRWCQRLGIKEAS